MTATESRTKANFGREIAKLEVNNLRVPPRLAARKARLAEMIDSFTLYSDDELFEEIYNLAKADGWDYVAEGPEGILDRSTIACIIDRCFCGAIPHDMARAYHEKTTWIEGGLFLDLQQQMATESL